MTATTAAPTTETLEVAVNARALVAAHPDDVRTLTLVAHEPPLQTLLPDRGAGDPDAFAAKLRDVLAEG